VFRQYQARERCTLGASSFFDEYPQSGEGCGAIEAWFVDCAAAGPECPS